MLTGRECGAESQVLWIYRVVRFHTPTVITGTEIQTLGATVHDVMCYRRPRFQSAKSHAPYLKRVKGNYRKKKLSNPSCGKTMVDKNGV